MRAKRNSFSLRNDTYPIRRTLILLFFGQLCICAIVNALAIDDLSIKGAISSRVPTSGLPDTFSGSLDLTVPVDDPCFFLSFNDPELKNRNKLVGRFSVTPIPRDRKIIVSGGTRILKSSSPVENINEQIIKVRAKKGTRVSFDFESLVPRLASDHDDQWFFQGFYPQMLNTCPSKNADPVYLEHVTARVINLTASILPNWTMLIPGNGAGVEEHVNYSVNVPSLGFVMARGLKTAEVQVGNQFLNLAYSDQEFLKLIPTLQESFAFMTKNFGELNLKHFWILEAKQFEADDVPGFIFLNRARQDSIHEFQSSWLNWMHWASVTLAARQWFGAFARASTINDDWFMRGSAEYAALVCLQQYAARFEFFNMQDGATSWLDFNFREMQDAGLTVLFQDQPNIKLVDKNLRTKIPYSQQHPMQPLRQAAALRHISSIVGKELVAQVLREVIRSASHENISPVQYYELLAKSIRTNVSGDLALSAFRRWWTEGVWFDASFDSFSQEKEGNEYELTVSLSYRTDFVAPVKVNFTDASGAKESVMVLPAQNEVTIKRKTPREITMVSIDEDREVYDVDRYNNSSSFPKVRFYPGNAKGIPDDGYTLVWLPYPFRRAGQGWALAVQTALFRYINNAAMFRFEREFSGKQRMGFSYVQNFISPLQGLGAQIAALQDFYGSRKIELSTLYDPRLFDFMNLQLGGAFRHRMVVGHAKSDHLTGAVSLLSSLPGDRNFWHYHVKLENEKAPPQESANFSYDRRFGVIDLEFLLFSLVQYKLRFFRGVIESTGENAPEEVFFRPAELSEARMRVDQSTALRAKNFYSVGQDILIPLLFNVPDFGIVSTSRLQWRMFYDFGQNLNDHISLADAGLGIDAPLGGDLSGVGALSISKMSLMVVLMSRVENAYQKKPSILFNIGSEF